MRTRIFFLSAPILFAFNPAAQAAFTSGNILINYFDTGTNAAGQPGVIQYSPTGALVRSFSLSNTDAWEGAALATGGNFASTYHSGDNSQVGFLVFASDGSLVAQHLTPQISAATSAPGVVSVFADGILAIPDQLGSAIRLYSQAGTYVNSITSPSLSHPVTTSIASDNTLWVANTDFNSIVHLREDGTILNSLPTTFKATQIAFDPADGSLWIGGLDNSIHHLTTTGSELGSFHVSLISNDPFGRSSNPLGLAFANDGTLYVDGTYDANLYRYSTTGTLLGSFPISTPGAAFVLTVVPAPEPASLFLAVFSAIPFLTRRCLPRR